MDDFKKILTLYSSKLNSNKLFLDEIIQIINETTTLSLSKDKVVVSGKELRFKLKSKERLLILIHKERILQKLIEAGIKITDLS